jgi:NitT/TauT family transport system ATP-binding protein
MLTVSNVGRVFPGGVVALRDTSLRLVESDFIALLGPSGCGKSTLLRLIARLDQPDSGRLGWDGRPPAPGDIGFVFQDATLLPWSTAEDNVFLPLRLRGMTRAAAMPVVHAALHRVGLAGFENARPRALSGGMRMRVSIARALVTKPRLLLMDEPFAALDAQTREVMQSELLRIWNAARKTVLFVTHQIDEAVYLSDRVVVMAARPGRVVADITIDLPRPRALEVKRTPEFAAYEEQIWRLIQHDRVPTAAEQAP